MYKVIRPPLHQSFELPSREELLMLEPGDLVKVIFQVADETPERLWTKLTKVGDEQWIGVIDNDPVGEETGKILTAGTQVSFHPLDTVQIWKS